MNSQTPRDCGLSHPRVTRSLFLHLRSRCPVGPVLPFSKTRRSVESVLKETFVNT